jgi:putative transposase
VIAVVVLWRPRHRLTLRDLVEKLLRRGIVFNHDADRAREAKLVPVLEDDLRRCRHGKGGAGTSPRYTSKFVAAGRTWTGPVDRNGNFIDAMPSEHRDTAAAQAFSRLAKAAAGVAPGRVTTDAPWLLPRGRFLPEVPWPLRSVYIGYAGVTHPSSRST